MSRTHRQIAGNTSAVDASANDEDVPVFLGEAGEVF